MQHSMVSLWQNMKQEASLCPMRRGKAELMHEACRPNHTIMKVLMAYIAHTKRWWVVESRSLPN